MIWSFVLLNTLHAINENDWKNYMADVKASEELARLKYVAVACTLPIPRKNRLGPW